MIQYDQWKGNIPYIIILFNASFTAKKKKHENLLKIAIIYLPKYQIIIGKQNIDGLTYKNLYK